MRVKKPNGRRRVHEELQKPFEYFYNKIDDILYDSSVRIEKKLFSPEYYNQKTAYNKAYLKPYLEQFDHVYDKQGILTDKEKKELHKYIIQAKQELRKDFRDIIKATDEDAYKNAVNEATYIVTSVAQKEENVLTNKRKLATEAVDYLIKKRPDLSDVLRQDLIDEVIKRAEVLLPKHRFVKQDEESTASSLWDKVIDNLNEYKPAPVAKKGPSIISRTVSSFGKKVSSVWDNISTKVTQSIEKVTDPIRTKIQTKNYTKIADSLFKSSHGSLIRKEIIMRGFNALVDNIDYYSRNKRALDEDAALLLNDIFLGRKKRFTKETTDILKGDGNHFELLCKVANRFGSISERKTAAVIKNLAVPRHTVESLPEGIWKRELLRRTLKQGENFHIKFSEFTRNLREKVVYTKGWLYYNYSGIDSKYIKVKAFTERIKSSKEHFAELKKEKRNKEYYELLYGKPETKAERIHNGQIDYVLLDRLTRNKLSKISDSFLTKLLRGKLKISAKNESDFKKLLFGSEPLPYNITERELLERAIPKLKDYQRENSYKFASHKQRPYKANFAKSMQSVFKGILKPFSKTPEYTDKRSVIMLPNGYLRMLRDDEHGYVDIAPDGTVKHAPGITNRLAYALGKYSVSEHTPYDPFFNPAGFHEGDKEELLWKNSELSEQQRANLARQATGATQAMLNGSAIHEIIDHYYKSGGKIVFNKERDMQPEILQKALVTINTLNLRYPKNQGWEIRTEQLIPGFGNLAKFQTAIDVFAYNKWTGKVEILDLKTGHLDDKYVQLQLSAEAYFAAKYSGTGYLTGDREIKAEDIGLFSINTTYKDLKTGERVYSADVKQHALYKLDSIKRIFSDDMWTAEAPGFMHGLKARLKPEVIDLDDIKNATLFMRTVLYGKDMPARFGFDFINKDGVYTDKDVIIFDLETTKTNKSKNEIQSLGALRFKVDPTKNKFFLAEVNESFFLTRGIPDELEPSSDIHDLTNPKVKELNRLKGKMKSAALSARGILNFMESIKGSIIIGQNVLDYDFSALYSELKRLAGDRYRERYKRKFADLFKTLTIIDTLTIYKAIKYDTLPLYDHLSGETSYQNIDIFNKVNGWAPPPSEAHGAIVDSFMTSSIGEALIRGRSDIPKRVSTFIRYIISHGVKGVTFVKGVTHQAEGSGPSGIPFAAVPTSVRLLNPYPDATGGVHVITQSGKEFVENSFSDEVSWTDVNEHSARAHLGFNYDPSKTDEENEDAYQEWFESRIGKHYDEHTAFELEEMRKEIRFKIIPKLTDRMLKKRYLAEETIKLFHKHLAQYTDNEDKFRFKCIMISEFRAIRNKLDEKIANKFEYLFFKGLNRKAVRELLDSPISIEVLNTNTRSINTPDDYIDANQLAMGFVGGPDGGYILMQDALAFQLEQVYNTKEEDKYFLMAEGKNDPSEGAQLVALSGDSIKQLKDVITSSIFSEYGGLLKKSELLAGRIENLDFTTTKSIIGTLASKAAITNNPQELKTYEAIAGLLVGGMPNAEELTSSFNASIQATKERLRDPKTLRSSLYSTMSKAGFSNGTIAKILSDEKVLKSFNADDYEKDINRASKIGVAREYMRNVFGLDMDEKKLAAVMLGDMSLDNLYNPEYIKENLGATEAYDDSRLKMIKSLQKQYGLSDKDVAHLKDTAKTNTPLSEFQDRISETGDAAKKAADRLKLVAHALSGISSVPFYDPERLFHAGYSQVGNIHSSLHGLIPSSLNNVVTKFLTGNIQEYEYGWQKPKYAIQLAKPLLPIIGGAVGGAVGGPAGAMLGSQIIPGMGAWASQLIGTQYERAINETGLFFSSRFNKMGAVITPAIAALNLFTKALKIASVPLLAGLGSGLYLYKRALNNMGTLDTPLYNLTDINYGKGYNQLSRLDYLFGMKRGTTNSIIESVEFAKQGLISLGRYDKNKLISSALLGIFNEAFMNPGNGASNYAAMTSKLYDNYQKSNNKRRFMYLLNEYNPELAKQLQVRTEYDSFLSSEKGALYKNREYYYNDIDRDQRNEFRVITGIQSSFGESIQNSFMKIAAALYNWKGFAFMNKYTSIIGNAADAFAGGKKRDIDRGFKIIGDGIIDFIDNLGKTWAEVKDKLGITGLKDTILTYGKIIYHEIKLKLIDLGLFVTDIFGKIKDPAKGFFMFLYEQFKKFFDFVGQIRLHIDWEKLKAGDIGGLQFKVGYKSPGIRDIGEYHAPPESGYYDPKKYMPVDTNLSSTSTSDISRQLYKALGVHVKVYENTYGKKYVGTTTPKLFSEAQFILDSMEQNGLPMTEEGLNKFLMNRSNYNRYFNDEEKAIIERVATVLGVDRASSALDNIIFPAADELLTYLTGGKDIESVTRDFLTEEKKKESKIIFEFKNDQGKSEQHEVIIGQQTGVVKVFGPNWKWGVI